LIDTTGIILCVPGGPYQERIKFYLYHIIHPHIRKMVYVYEFTVTFNKATCKVMSLILGHDDRIHRFCIFGNFMQQCRLEIAIFF
jgi:hypothetical protein